VHREHVEDLQLEEAPLGEFARSGAAGAGVGREMREEEHAREADETCLRAHVDSVDERYGERAWAPWSD
jgi:hypothetical protein